MIKQAPGQTPSTRHCRDQAPLTHDFHDPVTQKGAAALEGSETLQVQFPDVF